VRMGETMLGLAAVASTLPAWAGTAAATLLNMVVVDMCGVSRFRGVDFVFWQRFG
jgi:hypothetical protein